MPMDAHMVRHASGRDIYGDYGEVAYWSISDQAQHGVAQLMNQGRQEMIWRVKKAAGSEIYLARTAYVPDLEVTNEDEEAYRAASADCHAK